jgi:hypothetical protein
MICAACQGSGLARITQLGIDVAALPACGGCAGAGVVTRSDEDGDPLLDQLVTKWSDILAVILGEEDLPEEVSSQWRRRLVNLSLIDPKARTTLRDMSSDIHRWRARLACDVVMVRRQLLELADLCDRYQAAAASFGVLQADARRQRPLQVVKRY